MAEAKLTSRPTDRPTGVRTPPLTSKVTDAGSDQRSLALARCCKLVSKRVAGGGGGSAACLTGTQKVDDAGRGAGGT